MLITESARRFGYSPLRLLDQMEYLSEAEAAYDPAMVPVVESSEVDGYLVKVEDMVKFCESNGISDLGQGLYLVCESSGIDPSYVTFSVNQESLWESDMAELVADIMNEGVAVVGIPMNPLHPANIFVNAAINEMLEYGTDYILEAITYNDYSCFYESGELCCILAEADDQAKEEADTYGIKSSDVKIKKDGTTINGKKYDTVSNAGEKTESLLDKVKHYAGKPISWVRSILKKLHDWALRLEHEARNAENDKKGGFFNTLKMKVASAIEVLTRYMHNIGADERNKWMSTSEYRQTYGYDERPKDSKAISLAKIK